MIEPRDYCCDCLHYYVSMKDKPCKDCIETRLVKGKAVDTYIRKNFEPKVDQ